VLPWGETLVSGSLTDGGWEGVVLIEADEPLGERFVHLVVNDSPLVEQALNG
jgi:hypothetical protein